MLSNEFELREALRKLAKAGPQEPRPDGEQALLRAFRHQRKSRLRKWWISGAAAATITAALLRTLWPSPEPSRLEVHINYPAPPQLVQQAGVLDSAAPQRAAAHLAAKPHPKQSGNIPAEIATRFYALPDADMLVPLEEATVVRVELPRSAMRLVGLPVNEERLGEQIRADVLYGQDGIARAVRFVQ